MRADRVPGLGIVKGFMLTFTRRAAAETTRTFECMVYENPLRDALAKNPVGEASGLVDGQLTIPQGPGLGIEIDRDVLARLRVT